jgi:hypothetical protein
MAPGAAVIAISNDHERQLDERNFWRDDDIP